jgi:hypothetical protein
MPCEVMGHTGNSATSLVIVLPAWLATDRSWLTHPLEYLLEPLLAALTTHVFCTNTRFPGTGQFSLASLSTPIGEFSFQQICTTC